MNHDPTIVMMTTAVSSRAGEARRAANGLVAERDVTFLVAPRLGAIGPPHGGSVRGYCSAVRPVMTRP